MGLEFEGAADFGDKGGNFLSRPGMYLFVCTKIDEAPKGVLGGWAIESIVKGAPKGHEEEIGKTTNGIKFWPPKSTDKDGGEFKRKIQIRAAVALGWMRPKDLEPGVGFHVDDTSTASGRLFIAVVKKSDNDPRFMELDANRIYHIDDPAVKDFPIPKELLALVPPQARIPADEFAVFGPPADHKKEEKKDAGASGGTLNEDDLGAL